MSHVWYTEMRQPYSQTRSKPSNVLGISVSLTIIETTFTQYGICISKTELCEIIKFLFKSV